MRRCISVAVAFVLAVPAACCAQSPVPPVKTPGSKEKKEPAKAPVIAWETDCSSIEGWRSNADDPGMHATISQDEPATIKVTQDGADTWGKVAYPLKDINLDETPILEVKVNQVDLNSAFIVGVASADWTDYVPVIARSSADGMHVANITRAIRESSKKPDAWKGPVSFNLVIIIEGKGRSTYFDHIRIRSN